MEKKTWMSKLSNPPEQLTLSNVEFIYGGSLRGTEQHEHARRKLRKAEKKPPKCAMPSFPKIRLSPACYKHLRANRDQFKGKHSIINKITASAFKQPVLAAQTSSCRETPSR